VVAEPDERHANRTASVLECMTDTEYSTTSSSNEEAHCNIKIFSLSPDDPND